MSRPGDRAGSGATAGDRSLRPSMPLRFTEDIADDILYGFDVDEDSRQFLTSLIASGTAPRQEVERLYDISLTSGVDDWNMLIQCATSLRDRICNHRYGSQLTPYLAAIHLKRHDRWSELDDDAGHKTLPSSQRLKEEKPPRNEDIKASPKRSISLRRLQTTSHFFDDDYGNIYTGRSYRRDSRRNLPNIHTYDENIRQIHRESTPKRRRATSVASTTSNKRQSPNRLPREPLEECLTAGHFNPPREDDTDPVNGSREAFGIPPEQSVKESISCISKKETTPKRQRVRRTTSHFFDPPDDSKLATPSPSPGKNKSKRPARGTLSALPIPPLSATRFGLIQEELADEPFRLLIAVTFLIRTAGRAAIPVFRELMARYPTPEALAAADPENIIRVIHHLGLSSNRCTAIQKYARIWLERPPVQNVRYGVKNYPRPGDGRDVRLGEEFGAEDDHISPDLEEADALELDPEAKTKARGFGTSWEIGHLTQGPYAIDSWRIFCRDVLLGRAEDWKGAGRTPDFQPEWMRVLPQDKELRACLRWMWMREGWAWDPLTGEREVLSEEMRRAVDEGRVAYDNQGQLTILDSSGEALCASPSKAD